MGGREERKGRLRKGGLWKWRAKEEDVGSWSNYREGDGEGERGESVTEEERVEIREKKNTLLPCNKVAMNFFLCFCQRVDWCLL